MKHAISVLILLALSACGQAPAIPVYGQYLTTETESIAQGEDTTLDPATLPIDRHPSAAVTYDEAVNACYSRARHLCTRVEYDSAYHATKIAYSYGNPGEYWMKRLAIAPPSAAMRNTFQASNDGIGYLLRDTLYPFQFYCCIGVN